MLPSIALPARGRAPGHQAGGGVWLQACGYGPPRNLRDWSFYSRAPATKSYKLFVCNPLYCRGINLKRREKKFYRKLYIICFTHATPLTPFLTFPPHICTSTNIHMDNGYVSVHKYMHVFFFSSQIHKKLPLGPGQGQGRAWDESIWRSILRFSESTSQTVIFQIPCQINYLS